LIGKVTVIKTLAVPILVQPFTVLPDPPIHIIKEIQDIFFNFLWNNKVDKVKRDTVIGNYEDGGLIMPHVLSFVHALTISWVKRVLDPDNYAQWKVLLTEVLDDLGQEKVWYYSQSALKVLSPKFSPFWKNVINVCASLKDDFSTAPEDILSQPIWHNGRIRVGGQPILFSHWAKSGIFCINDLIKEDGSLLSLTD
jgi:hypothetical protein